MNAPNTNNQAQSNLHPFEKAGLGKPPYRVISVVEKTYQACPDAPVQPAGCCDYCYTGLRYVYVIKSADNRSFGVGCDCVAKVDRDLSIEAKQTRRIFDNEKRYQATKAEREAAKAAREAEHARLAAEIAAKCEAFLTAHPGLADALQLDDEAVQDINARFRVWGELSDRQVAFVVSKAAPKAKAPITDKRITIVGTIKSKKSVESIYGYTMKTVIEVETPEGIWATYGTLPTAVYEGDWSREVVGLKIQFDAKIEPSDRDESFCFFKRPTKVKVLQG